MKIFHHNDIDGHAAAAVIRHLYPNPSSQYIECNYAFSLMPYIETIALGEQVFVVDYSFTPATLHELQAMYQRAGKWPVWIDHHDSSLALQNQYPKLKDIPGIRKKDISGAALTWMHFYGVSFPQIPLALQHISDYDCWLKTMPGTNTIYHGILAGDWNYDSTLWTKLFTNDALVPTLQNQGQVILNYLRKDNQITCDKWAFETLFQGHRCLAINRKVNSEVFGSDLSRYPLYCIFQFDGKIWRYSIYSQTLDCSQLASTFGGGGHKGAAGFSHPTCLFAVPPTTQ